MAEPQSWSIIPLTNAMRPVRTTILVVENEAIICLELAYWLEKMGSEVLRASDADQAIALMGAHSNIRLLVTDIRMPGSMDGVRLAHHVRDRWPPVKIIVASGIIDTPPSALPKRSVLIAKPYKPQELWAAASQLMPGRGPRPAANQAFLPF